ncbi:HugZ family heme oxygenase [Campylobacter sp. MIT 21-1685]|uniref:HugZ family heme oxygenase n=1 Tax=unclassified Campylobacter TaxID=2593542 RepID=UPI00224A605F|nr:MULTISPECIES: HugZ family heme oxygenase [unclassified Campylobacter]MCX2682686.1 HugZ family heme oxygenase [Campylobacter sp. MIT 21-1684]MCX2750966.1 HugZ family heme oxygenase [Campylobacter sp. MIT 21-1682]MCX2807101.1 HugZ family heme oxygenase [Campylobacter sp. MIT 21-1685]
MNFADILSHMNEHHTSNLIDLCRKFGKQKEIKDVFLENVDFEGLDIVYNMKEKLHIPFPNKADENTIKQTIIQLCMDAKAEHNFSDLQKEINDFIMSFHSVCLATINTHSQVICSYAPFVRSEFGDFIYISEVSEHFAAIKNYPENIEAMFLEDESKAVSPILRKRLRYRVKASFVERGKLFDQVFDEFERQTGGANGIKTIRAMLDFHLIRFEFGKGRFVKGFGQAFDISNTGEITQVGAKMPHKT